MQHGRPDDCEIRYPAATLPIGQLGYEMPQSEIGRRLTAVLAQAEHRVWVYDDGGKVVGLLHAFFRPALDKPPEVMVQALVIEASQRSKGVGEALMQVAESWAREKGCTSVALYSRVDRDRAPASTSGLVMRRSRRPRCSGRSGEGHSAHAIAPDRGPFLPSLPPGVAKRSRVAGRGRGWGAPLAPSK